MDLSQLPMEYEEILQHENIRQLLKSALGELVRFLASSEDYRTVTTLPARILAAKPHSADFEQVISSSTAYCLEISEREPIVVGDGERLLLYPS